MLLKIYNEDKSPKQTTCEPTEGEPGFLFHEFIFLLGLIALHCMEHTPTTATLIEDFFVEKLNFKRQTSIPRYNEKKKAAGAEGEDDEYYDEEVASDEELEMDEQQKQFMAFLERKQYEDDNFIVDFEEILNVLD